MPSAPHDLVFVDLAVRETGHEELEDSRGAQAAHHQTPSVPAAEVTDHADPPGVGSPDGKGVARNTVDFGRTRPQALPQLLVRAFGEEIEVHVADRRGKAVGIIARPSRTVGKAEARPIAQVGGDVLDPDREEALP